MADITPHQALRYLEKRLGPPTPEQTVTDELAFNALWNLVIHGEESLL